MEIQFRRIVRAREVGIATIRPGCRSRALPRRERPRTDRLDLSTVLVRVELGAGNRLFIRGQGGPLSWEYGQPLTTVEPGTLIWSCLGPADSFEFQLLLDDEVWERGRPHQLGRGQTICVSPDFEWPEMPRVARPCQMSSSRRAVAR